MILVLLKSIWRDDYPKRFGVLLEIFSTLIMLTVFWYTSQAFTPKLPHQVSYFDYLVTAEVILYLPLLMLQHNIRLGKKMARRGTFDFFFVHEISILRYFAYYSSAYLVKDLARLLLLVILSVTIFSFSLSLKTFAILLLLILFMAVVMTVLGMAVGLCLIFWGRGEGSFGQLVSLSSILAGAYFPLEVFPNWLQKLSFLLNPITPFLEYGRQLIGGHTGLPPWELWLWVALTVVLYQMVYHLGLKAYRTHGPPADVTF